MQPYPAPDLKQYWYKFLTGVLSLLSMRKTWLMVAADLAAYTQYRAGTITPEEFLAIVLGGLATLIVGITAEDVAGKLGRGKA